MANPARLAQEAMPWSDYGPWIWHTGYQRYFRQCQNHLGERKTEWAPIVSPGEATAEHVAEAPPPEVPSVTEEGEKKKKRRRRRGKGKRNKVRGSDSESDSDGETDHELGKATYPLSPTASNGADDSGYMNDDAPNFYADPETDDEPFIIESDTDSLYVEPVPTQSPVHYPQDTGANVISTEAENGQTWVLDPRYRVHSSSTFQPGEVFKILWSEPIGKSATGAATSVSDSRTYVDSYGEKFYVGFRRFIVVANDAGHCTCVPILTYGGRGCKKSGVKPDRHGIVVQTGHSSRLIPGEPMLGFPAIHIDIRAKGERLAKESRVNYSKLVTIEHNVKVFFVGSVIPQDADQIKEAVNECWTRKSFHRRSNT